LLPVDRAASERPEREEPDPELLPELADELLEEEPPPPLEPPLLANALPDRAREMAMAVAKDACCSLFIG
jgi:hypothetical protein